MKTFALAEKPSSRAKQRMPAPPFALAGRAAHLQRDQIRHILHCPRAQAKLTIAAPNDVYEQEADRVAEAVMRMADPQLSDSNNNWQAWRECPHPARLSGLRG